MTYISSEEQVAMHISQAFPAADLTTTGEGKDKVFEISLNGKVLIRIDKVGIESFFSTRGFGKMSWSTVIEGSPQTLAEYKVRELADAGYTVYSSRGTRVEKTRVFIGSHTCCPKCNETRNIRVIVFEVLPSELDTSKLVSGGRGKGINDPEIKCINCGWEGFKEEVRFTRKIRVKREE
jgi:predicted nucleic-acid-binding Zn-ribbon protein